MSYSQRTLLSCQPLDNDNNTEGFINAGDINQDGITNVALSVPFQDDGGSDSAAVFILFINYRAEVTDPTMISIRVCSKTSSASAIAIDNLSLTLLFWSDAWPFLLLG
jgi:hypothetical protein